MLIYLHVYWTNLYINRMQLNVYIMDYMPYNRISNSNPTAIKGEIRTLIHKLHLKEYTVTINTCLGW